MTDPLTKRSLSELDTVLDEIVQRNPEWYKEILELVEELKNEQSNRRRKNCRTQQAD